MTKQSFCSNIDMSETAKRPAAHALKPSRPEDDVAGYERPVLFLWSAADETGLKRIASVYVDHLSGCTAVPNARKYLQDLAFTLADRRTPLRWRSYKISTSLKDLWHGLMHKPLEAFRARTHPHLGIVFTGQGAQWHGMSRELAHVPVFNDSLMVSQRILRALGCNWSLKGE